MNYTELDVWIESRKLVKIIYEACSLFPAEEKFGISSQIKRSAISIPSNIAEGCSRNSEIEFKRFLEIAIGSLFELETQLIITQELELISKDKLEPIFELLNKEAKMINSLINTIKNS